MAVVVEKKKLWQNFKWKALYWSEDDGQKKNEKKNIAIKTEKCKMKRKKQ